MFRNTLRDEQHAGISTTCSIVQHPRVYRHRSTLRNILNDPMGDGSCLRNVPTSNNGKHLRGVAVLSLFSGRLPGVHPISPVFLSRTPEGSCADSSVLSHTFGEKAGSMRLIFLTVLRLEPRVSSLRSVSAGVPSLLVVDQRYTYGRCTG